MSTLNRTILVCALALIGTGSANADFWSDLKKNAKEAQERAKEKQKQESLAKQRGYLVTDAYIDKVDKFEAELFKTLLSTPEKIIASGDEKALDIFSAAYLAATGTECAGLKTAQTLYWPTQGTPAGNTEVLALAERCFDPSIPTVTQYSAEDERSKLTAYWRARATSLQNKVQQAKKAEADAIAKKASEELAAKQKIESDKKVAEEAARRITEERATAIAKAEQAATGTDIVAKLKAQQFLAVKKEEAILASILSRELKDWKEYPLTVSTSLDHAAAQWKEIKQLGPMWEISKDDPPQTWKLFGFPIGLWIVEGCAPSRYIGVYRTARIKDALARAPLVTGDGFNELYPETKRDLEKYVSLRIENMKGYLSYDSPKDLARLIGVAFSSTGGKFSEQELLSAIQSAEKSITNEWASDCGAASTQELISTIVQKGQQFASTAKQAGAQDSARIAKIRAGKENASDVTEAIDILAPKNGLPLLTMPSSHPDKGLYTIYGSISRVEGDRILIKGSRGGSNPGWAWVIKATDTPIDRNVKSLAVGSTVQIVGIYSANERGTLTDKTPIMMPVINARHIGGIDVGRIMQRLN